MKEDVQDVFGIYNTSLELSLKPDRSQPVASVADVAGRVVYVFKVEYIFSNTF